MRIRAGVVGVATALALIGAAVWVGWGLHSGDETAGEPAAHLEVGRILGGADTAGWARALRPRSFVFPEDHGSHPDYRTEWWYVTGNLETPGGRRFGYQFTLFRFALAPPVSGPPDDSSAWRTRQAWMAELALTDADGGRFHTDERFARGALGLAGATARPFRVWLENWSMAGVDSAAFPARLQAASDSFGLDLLLERGKPPVPEGEDGLSRKGPSPGNASYYYSLPRMPTRGRVWVGADTFRVGGSSWMDREWGTSSLGPGIRGWDWMALQLNDGGELTYYRLRRGDGTAAPESSGTWIGPGGEVRRLEPDQVELEPTEWWSSPEGGTRYPVGWRVAVPSEGLDLTLRPLLRDQEWRGAFRYWEGAVELRGRRESRPVRGRGYLELTGYGSAAPPGSG